MKTSEIIELISSIGIALTGFGSALNGVAKVIKATKKEPQKTARPRKFKYGSIVGRERKLPHLLF